MIVFELKENNPRNPTAKTKKGKPEGLPFCIECRVLWLHVLAATGHASQSGKTGTEKEHGCWLGNGV